MSLFANCATKSKYSKLAVGCAVAASSAFFGCGAVETPAADASSASDGDATLNPTDSIDPTDVPPGPVCTPGATQACVTDKKITICNKDGTAWEDKNCYDDAGGPSACQTLPKPHCTHCVPGVKACDPKDETKTHACSNDGEWLKSEQCDLSLGQQCAPGGLCEASCDINIKAKSYVGCAFWATDLDNAFVPGGKEGYFDAANAQYAIVVANPSDIASANLKIETNEGVQLDSSDPSKPLDFSPLAPGELRTFLLPPRNINATSQDPLAWRVTSSSPVAAYQFNPLENVNVFSNDASLLLPEGVLGDYYIVMTRGETFSILRSYVTVVATQGGPTNVSITFSSTTGKTLASQDGTIKSFKSNESAQFVLEKYDTLNIETDVVGGDLTGTVVLADRKVAVFGGSEAANVPNTDICTLDNCSPSDLAKGKKCGLCSWDNKTTCKNNEDCQQFVTCCADHLEMQMFPVQVWDSQYVAVKLKPRGKEADSWRIIAATDGTKIALNPPQKDPHGKGINIPVLDKGEWFEFEVDCGPGADVKNGLCPGGSFEVAAKHQDGTPAPISLGHFMASQDTPGPGAQEGDAGTGDPAFLLSIPVAQWRTDYVFLTPDKYSVNYISIAAPVDAQVTFDGEPIAPDLFKIISPKYKYCWLFVNPGPHTVKGVAAPRAADGPANPTPHVAVDVYGFDQYVSYGYPAGLDLKDLEMIVKPKARQP